MSLKRFLRALFRAFEPIPVGEDGYLLICPDLYRGIVTYVPMPRLILPMPRELKDALAGA